MLSCAGCSVQLSELSSNHFSFLLLLETLLNSQLASSASLEGKGQLKFTTGRWSPHHSCTQVATANDTAVRGWDTRTMRSVRHLDPPPHRERLALSPVARVLVSFLWGAALTFLHASSSAHAPPWWPCARGGLSVPAGACLCPWGPVCAGN